MVRSKADTVRLISQSSNIASETVYKSLPSLEEKGLIEKILEKPIRYHAIPANEAMKALTREDRKTRNNIYKKADALAQNIMNCLTFEQNIDNKDELQVIKGLNSETKVFDELLRKAKDSFDGMTYPRQFRYGMTHCSFRHLVRRGIKCRHVVIYDTESLSFDLGDKTLSDNPLWIRKPAFGISASFSLIDEEEVLLDISQNSLLKNHLTLRSRNPCLLTLAKGYYEALWNTITNREEEEPRQ
jgi:Fe2+ or Zn2+ uptake regulation protein